jgi:hypothetical protein
MVGVPSTHDISDHPHPQHGHMPSPAYLSHPAFYIIDTYVHLHKQSKHVAQQNCSHTHTPVQTLVILLSILWLIQALCKVGSCCGLGIMHFRTTWCTYTVRIQLVSSASAPSSCLASPSSNPHHLCLPSPLSTMDRPISLDRTLLDCSDCQPTCNMHHPTQAATLSLYHPQPLAVLGLFWDLIAY